MEIKTIILVNGHKETNLSPHKETNMSPHIEDQISVKRVKQKIDGDVSIVSIVDQVVTRSVIALQKTRRGRSSGGRCDRERSPTCE